MTVPTRADIATIRATLSIFQFVVAECDTDLRYVWIDNPHPDFDSTTVIGKRDDDLVPRAEAEDLICLKQNVLTEAVPTRRVIGFQRTDGYRLYCISAFPLRNAAGAVDGVFTIAFDAPGVLHGIIPICAHCKKIRDDRGVWQTIETYIGSKTEATLSHGICEECVRVFYPDFAGK